MTRYDISVGGFPVIGVTPGIAGPSAQREFCRGSDVVYCDVNYLRRIENEQAIPLVLPTGGDRDQLVELCSRLDGFLFTGGEDVDPVRYGQTNHFAAVSQARDRLELQLLDVMCELNIPLLAICRGCQVVNVHFGGTLIQDLPSQVGTLQHEQSCPTSEPSHEVEIAEDSRLRHVYGKHYLEVNSHHHQAIDQAGAGLRVVAWAEDGIAEAFEALNHRYLVGVQWHPERMSSRAAEQQRLFADFVSACREFHHGR